jgi:prepilin-type processing-associated H-X9-DG protein
VQLSKNSWVAGNPRQDVTTENITRGTLYQHVGSTATYRCPMDLSSVNLHPEIPRTRSYSMSSYLGGDPVYNPKFKYSEISRPDTVFVFIEEHESSRWDSSFFVQPPRKPTAVSAASSAGWLSIPSDRHEQGCNISFADGHFEYWRWLAPKEPSDPGMHATEHSVRLASGAGLHASAILPALISIRRLLIRRELVCLLAKFAPTQVSSYTLASVHSVCSAGCRYSDSFFSRRSAESRFSGKRNRDFASHPSP